MAVTARCCYSVNENLPFSLYFVIFILGSLTNAQIRYSIPEELENGALVGDIVRDLGLDLRKLSTRRVRITSDSGRRYFTINHKTGKLVVSDRIDRETVCEFSGTCTRNLEVVLENPLEVHNVEVDILDVNDNAPQFPRDEYQLEVSESALTSSRFHIEGAQDADDGSNSVKQYRLSPNDHLTLDSIKPFSNNKHIEFILKKPFDREQKPSHQLILTAMDGGTPQRTGTAIINPRVPSQDWRYSASLRAGGVMQSSVHMEESSVMQGAQGVLVQNWPTASSAADAEGGEVSPPMGAGVDSNSWHFRYGPGGPGAPPQHLKPGDVPPEAFIIPGSPAIISIRQNQGGEDDKSDFITFGKKEEAKKKKKKKKEKKDKKDKGKDDGDE
ncbi:protocadherin alpha-C2-like isoform X13 [Eleginops maclovinus]|uniref:protocadherin alpha-C2-like isoform X13 n=1 Tax=Eleginops maclovinus TaxID=56733 RepID=UPI0030801B52